MPLSQKERNISVENSEVLKFYDRKSILITGATGFLGEILLEILLRCCSNIGSIYILLRPKRGILPEDRKQAIFEKEIFSKLKEKNPDVLRKVTVVSGDIIRENLGMSDDDLQKIIENVSIVFHCAASISFVKPLRFMLLHNVIATYSITKLCRKLKKLDALIYTSTAYSCSNRVAVIEERIYKMPFTAEEALNAFRNGNDEELESLYTACVPKFPNYYTFSKCLAENLLSEKASDLPVAIVRPSVIVCCWKHPLPGYVESGSAMVSVCLGIGMGLIRVLPMSGNTKIDTIPVDVVASTHVLSAWQQATQRFPSPVIYNCISSEVRPCTWTEYTNALLNVVKTNPLPRSYRNPSVLMCEKKMEYWLQTFFSHYVPAAIMDSLLWLTGQKSRFLQKCKFFDRSIKMCLFFLKNEIRFKSDNFQSLGKKTNAVDEELFPVDLSDYDIAEVAKLLPTGAPFFRWNGDKNTLKKSMRLAYASRILTSLMQWVLMGSLLLLLYKIVF